MPNDDAPRARIIIIEVNESGASIAELVQQLGFSSKPNNIFQEKVEHVGDKYEASGQVGAMGRKAKAEGNTFSQIWADHSSEIDLPSLAVELEALRSAMKAEASTAEQDLLVAHVAQAQIEAQNGNGVAVLQHLKNAGQWALTVAKNVGIHVAALAISHAIAG